MELPGEKLITRMWETLSEKGIGSLLWPWQMKREGLAQLELRRAELLANAQTEKDADLIRTGKKKLEDFSTELNFASPSLVPSVAKVRTEPTIDLPTLFEAISQQRIEDSVRHHINVAHAICHAEEALRDDPQDPPSTKIDDDWLYRWRDYAGEVSSESMQALWGRILAGEVKSPGSFSLRTLNFVRDLSQEDAKNIEHLLQFVIEHFIWRDDSLDIPFTVLMSMQDLGVISGMDSAGIVWNFASDDQSTYLKAITSQGQVIIIKHDNPNRKLSLPVYLLTGIGKELLQLGKFPANMPYLERVCVAINKDGFSVSLAEITHIAGEVIHFINERPIQA